MDFSQPHHPTSPPPPPVSTIQASMEVHLSLYCAEHWVVRSSGNGC